MNDYPEDSNYDEQQFWWQVMSQEEEQQFEAMFDKKQASEQ